MFSLRHLSSLSSSDARLFLDTAPDVLCLETRVKGVKPGDYLQFSNLLKMFPIPLETTDATRRHVRYLVY